MFHNVDGVVCIPTIVPLASLSVLTTLSPMLNLAILLVGIILCSLLIAKVTIKHDNHADLNLNLWSSVKCVDIPPPKGHKLFVAARLYVRALFMDMEANWV